MAVCRKATELGSTALELASQTTAWGSGAQAASGNMLEVQKLGLHPRPSEPTPAF